ncbi:MAG: PAS domain S-box protein [Hydrogenophaga sp.]|nr:PAS domain S-box protein [Hydrogenophaga sp.]
MKTPSLHPPTDDQKSLRLRTQKTVSLLVGAVSLGMAIYLFAFGDKATDAIGPAVIAAFAVAAYVPLRTGQSLYSAHLLIAGVLVAATIAAISFGSVRAASVMLFIAAVTGAGIFTGRRALLVTTLTSIVLLAALTWAEWYGLLTLRHSSVGLPALVSYVATTVVVALMVYYSRRTNERTLDRLRAELQTRIRTEQERDRSLDRFARIFRTSPSPMLAQSARDGTILDVNPAFERCYGYTRDRVVGKLDLLLWADLEQRKAYLETLARFRRTERVAGQSLRSDGSHFDVLVSSEMSDDPDDRLVITTILDVTAQNEAMERLKKSEERFAKAFNFSPLNLSITRMSDGTILEVNRATSETQGSSPQALAGINAKDIGLWADSSEREAFLDMLQKDGHVHGYETRIRHRDGHLFDVRIWAERIEIDGEDCILSCAVDVSAEKQRENQLIALTRGMAGPSGNALFEALTLHMAKVIEADRVVVGEMLDEERLRTVAIWQDGATAPNIERELSYSPFGKTLAHPGLYIVTQDLASAFPDCPALTDDGMQAFAGQALRDEDGTSIGLIGAFWRHPIDLPSDARALVAIFASRANAELIRVRRDREIRRLNSSLEKRVKERTAELEKLNAELDSFAYSVSHDLKSPLRAIDGFTQLLQESLQGRLDPSEQQVFSRVLAATDRMAKLIADLLALARVSQGTLERSQIDLSAMAEQALSHIQEQHPERDLQWHIEPGLNTLADPRLARIVLDNLLDNAVKYTRDQPQALIELGQLPGEQGQPGDFFIRDNGVGFDMAYAHKLFQPFQRLHMPSSGFEGTGIGLATVRRVVDRHGGHISAESAPGHGATFRFSFGATRPMRAMPSIRRLEHPA